MQKLLIYSVTVHQPPATRARVTELFHDQSLIRKHYLGASRSTSVHARLMRWTKTTVSLATIDHLLSSDRLVAAAILCVLDDFVAHTRRDSQSNTLLISMEG